MKFLKLIILSAVLTCSVTSQSMPMELVKQQQPYDSNIDAIKLSSSRSIEAFANRFRIIPRQQRPSEQALVKILKASQINLDEALFSIAQSNENYWFIPFLVQAGAKIDVEEQSGSTPLHWAAFDGHLPVVQALIAAGANINAQDLYHWTPLHWAAFNGHTNVAQALITAGADINAQNNEHRTPIHYASTYEYLDIVKALNKVISISRPPFK